MIKFLPALMCPSTKEEEDKEKKKAEGKEPPTGLSVSCYKLWRAHFPKSGTYICTSVSPGFWKRGKCMFRLIKVDYQLFISQQISYIDKLISWVALHLSIFDTNNFSQYNLNSQYLHQSISHLYKFFFFLFFFVYKSSIVFHQNSFFEPRWDYT